MAEENERIFDILLTGDEITWQGLIMDLVKSGEVDPWDVDVSMLSSKYLELVGKLKEMDLRVGGKVLLAASILLRLKSNKLMGTDLTALEMLMREQPEEMEDFLDGDLEEQLDALERIVPEKPTLIPRTPQPRDRKVTIYDLVEALEKALKTKRNKITRNIDDVKIRAPLKTKDITQVIAEVYTKIMGHFMEHRQEKIHFNDLTPSQNKEDKIFTFIPLLHLTNHRKIDLEQEDHFGPIQVKVLAQEEK